MSSRIPVAISFTGVANFLGVVGVIGSLVFRFGVKAIPAELRQTQRIANLASTYGAKMKSVWKIYHGMSSQLATLYQIAASSLLLDNQRE